MSIHNNSQVTLPLPSSRRSPQTEPQSKPLRTFSGIHVDEDVRGLEGEFDNHLFYNCTFGSLKNLKLTNCVLDKSRFTETDPAKMLGFSVTLDCNSFSGVELSPEAFDLICMLLVKSKGNTDKRLALIKHVVGHAQSVKYLSKLRTLE